MPQAADVSVRNIAPVSCIRGSVELADALELRVDCRRISRARRLRRPRPIEDALTGAPRRSYAP